MLDTVKGLDVDLQSVLDRVEPIEIYKPVDDPLKGYLVAEVYEDGKRSNHIIREDQHWSVRVWWWLDGDLWECICGNWCLKLHFESIGHGEEFSEPYGDGFKIPLDPCKRHYHYDFKFWYDKFKPKCAVPYKMVVTLTYETLCGTRGQMGGHYELPLVTFLETTKGKVEK